MPAKSTDLRNRRMLQILVDQPIRMGDATRGLSVWERRTRRGPQQVTSSID